MENYAIAMPAKHARKRSLGSQIAYDPVQSGKGSSVEMPIPCFIYSADILRLFDFRSGRAPFSSAEGACQKNKCHLMVSTT